MVSEIKDKSQLGRLKADSHKVVSTRRTNKEKVENVQVIIQAMILVAIETVKEVVQAV